MTDTPRTSNYLVTNQFQDGQSNGSISPQRVRDLIVSIPYLGATVPVALGLPAIYVDSVNGDDAAQGGAGDPFQTLARASASMQPNSVVNLVPGSVFQETLVINQPGVTVQPSSAGTAPRISGGTTVPPATSSWTQESTVPVFLDQETFESGTISSYWTTQAGAVDATKAKNGTKSWKFAPSSGDLDCQNVGVSSNYAETTGYVYIDSASTATTGQHARLVFYEGTGWNAANGVSFGVQNASGVIQLGLGRGSTLTTVSTIATNTWIQFRFTVTANGGGSTDRADLYLAGATSPTLSLTGLTLASALNQKVTWGVFAFNPTAWIANFDDFTIWNQPSVAALTNLWYSPNIATGPMAVTLGGSLGGRKLGKAKLATASDYWWDARNSRLYVYNTANPYTAYSTIEYSQRKYPVQVKAPGVTVASGITISHHNLDDGTIGVQTNNYFGTVVGASGSFNGKDVVNYVLRPGRDDSLWNRRLTGSETYSAAPAGFGSQGSGLSGWESPSSGSIATFYSVVGDPIVNVNFYNPGGTINANLFSATWLGHGNSGAVETTILAGTSAAIQPTTPFGSMSRYFYQTTNRGGSGWNLPSYPVVRPAKDPGTSSGRAIHCPVGAFPSGDGDSHFAVYQPNGLVMESYATIVLSTGDLTVGNWNLTDPSGLMDGSCAGMTAALCPNFSGLLRDAELTAGIIPHALSITIPGTYLTQSFVAPATSFDRSSTYTGTLPMGTRFAIPPSVNLSAHAFLSALGPVLAKAAQDFGMIVVDFGGEFIVRTEGAVGGANAVLNTFDGASGTDLSWIVSQLQVVTGVA